MRICPRCHIPLEARLEPGRLPGRLGELAGATVHADACPRCAGRFLDRGEVGALAGRLGLDGVLAPPKAAYVDGARCPGCRATMAFRQLAGVTVDACPQCGGFWFDPGEIGRLRKGMKAPPEG